MTTIILQTHPMCKKQPMISPQALVSFLLILAASTIRTNCYRLGRDPLGDFIINGRSTRTYENQATWGDSDKYFEAHVASQDGMKESDRILELPGQPQVNFSQFSGYVTVDPHAGRALFYWLTESENPSEHPLVLWLAGGPGCSSVGVGVMSELGPFRVNPDGKTLWYNEHAWNTVANILFLESPAGVGFSYSNTSSDYVTGDTRTATDAYNFLVNWLERFPEYKTRDFYIAGESYGGHYVPQLAQLIIKTNKVMGRTIINLKGIAIGNPYIDYQDTMSGIYDYFWSHALISDESHDAILKNCDFSTKSSVTQSCSESMNAATNDWGNVFIYDIYASLCGSNSTTPTITTFDPCSYNYIFAYLNSPEVQKALHANVTGSVPGPWDQCSTFIRGWNDKPETVLPVIKELMTSGINIWIYSGDTDGRVPVTSTRYSMKKIGARVKTPWFPWYDDRSEVGGYAIEYHNITFVTVRGAGHFVPSYQPSRALTFFSSFISGKLSPQHSF